MNYKVGWYRQIITLGSKSSDNSLANRHPKLYKQQVTQLLGTFTFLSSPSPLLLHTLFIIMAADLPDFMTDPNAVLKDTEHEWRYKRVPDYKKVNEAYEKGKKFGCYLRLGP